MISPRDAQTLISAELEKSNGEKVPLLKAFGRVLMEDISADRDFPPFNRVAMDGIAINRSGFDHNSGILNVEGIQASGAPPKTLTSPDNCIEVMTGAVLPSGCDAVVPYEQVKIEKGRARVVEGLTPSELMNVHIQGSDKNQGELLLAKGSLLKGPQIAVAASVGLTELNVSKTPSITILSTGDELVSVEENPLPHQIRASNSYALQSVLENQGFEKVRRIHVQDDRDKMKEEISSSLDSSDFLLMTGGVSKGKFDFVPEILEQLEVKKVFHRVAQKPGKPIWFGTKSGENKKFVFGLPGNPVAVMVCCYRYVLPCIQEWMGIKEKNNPRVILNSSLNPKKDLTHFVPVLIDPDSGHAVPVKSNGSGDLVSIGISNGFVELDKADFGKSSAPLPYYNWN